MAVLHHRRQISLQFQHISMQPPPSRRPPLLHIHNHMHNTMQKHKQYIYIYKYINTKKSTTTTIFTHSYLLYPLSRHIPHIRPSIQIHPFNCARVTKKADKKHNFFSPSLAPKVSNLTPNHKKNPTQNSFYFSIFNSPFPISTVLFFTAFTH